MKAVGRLAAIAGLACAIATPLTHAQPADENPALIEDIEDDLYSGDWEAEAPARPQTDLAAIDAAHADYLRRTDLQLTRPEADLDPVEFDPPPGWLQSVARFLDWLGPLFRWIFYAAAAAVICGVLYFLFGEAVRLRLGFGAGRKRPGKDDGLIDLRPDATRARSLLDEADALARAGRFAEAVHLLLFRSIEDIQQKIDGGVPRSLTAREIAGFERLPARARGALQPIIRIVEQSFFGGRQVDQDGWTTARTSYEDFAFGAAWT